MRWVWLFALVAACKSDETKPAKPIVPAPVTFASGSRLHAMFHEVDGVKLLVGWQDTQLGKPCTFLGGRCVPGTTRHESDSLALFDDPACTSRVIQKPGESDFDPAFDVVAIGSAQCDEVTLYLPGEAIVPLRVYRHGASGACEETFFAGGEVLRLNAIGADGNEPFVRAHEENDGAGGRIVTRWLVADDGARQIVGGWDVERNVRVEVPNGARRWYPQDRAAIASEARCPGVATSYACEPAAVFIGGDGCREPDVYAVGARLADDACGASAGRSYEVLSAIPNELFAPAKGVDVGAARIRLTMFARGSDERPIAPRRFFDTEAGVPCSPNGSADKPDELRCRPDADSRVAPAYAEEGCTKKAALFTPGAGACDATPDVPHIVALSGEPVEIGERIYRAWQSNSAGGCDPVVFANDASAYLITPVDPSRFVLVVLKTE